VSKKLRVYPSVFDRRKQLGCTHKTYVFKKLGAALALSDPHSNKIAFGINLLKKKSSDRTS
jgi:hypothetical protein